MTTCWTCSVGAFRRAFKSAARRTTYANIAAHPEARLNTIVETDRAAAEWLAGPYGAVLRDQAEALADPAIDAVVIASSTDTHADLVEAAARAGKANSGAASCPR
jgi:predicted dehydrogenase